jgi:hypothetical protein
VESVFFILFAALFFSVLVWFFLCHRLFAMLEARHPEKYESMGKPTLIKNNTLSTNITFMKFLLRREWPSFLGGLHNDVGLTKLSRFMLAFWIIYLVGFLTLFSMVVSDMLV